MQTNTATIEITQPKVFTLRAVVMVNAYGLLLVGPVLAAMVVVSLIKFSALTVLIPLAVVAGTAYFLPFGGGNTHVRRLVRSLGAARGKGGEGFVVQLTLWPRIRSGLQAVMEDADDIGWLTFEKEGVRFEGDSVKAFVPYERIQAVHTENSGLRGGFVYGRRIKVLVPDLRKTECLEFMERSSWFLPESRRITRELCVELSAKIGRRARDRAVTGAEPGQPTPAARR
jgi:hypothetical protein